MAVVRGSSPIIYKPTSHTFWELPSLKIQQLSLLHCVRCYLLDIATSLWSPLSPSLAGVGGNVDVVISSR